MLTFHDCALGCADMENHNIFADVAVCRACQSVSRTSGASPTSTPSIASALDKEKEKGRTGGFKFFGGSKEPNTQRI